MCSRFHFTSPYAPLILGAGGVGELMADWIIDGAPKQDFWSFDVRRFVGLHNNRMFLSERVKETLGLSYAIRYPDLQFESSRELLRTSPLYTRLEVEGSSISRCCSSSVVILCSHFFLC